MYSTVQCTAHLSTKRRTTLSSGVRSACARATRRWTCRFSRCSLNAPPAPLMSTRPTPLSRPSTCTVQRGSVRKCEPPLHDLFVSGKWVRHIEILCSLVVMNLLACCAPKVKQWAFKLSVHHVFSYDLTWILQEKSEYVNLKTINGSAAHHASVTVRLFSGHRHYIQLYIEIIGWFEKW